MTSPSSIAARTGVASCSPRIPAASHAQGRKHLQLRHSVITAAVGRTAYSFETQRLAKLVATRQAVKTTLNYLAETNGELHFFLHNYVSERPLPLDPAVDADDWLVELATTPLTKVADPRRSSVVCAAAAAAVLGGEREVSPREVADRLMQLREHIAREMVEELQGMKHNNENVLRRCLERTFGKSVE